MAHDWQKQDHNTERSSQNEKQSESSEEKIVSSACFFFAPISKK